MNTAEQEVGAWLTHISKAPPSTSLNKAVLEATCVKKPECLTSSSLPGSHPVQNNARVEHEVRVKQALELPHKVIGLAAPLHLHKWRHIAARAVLTLHNRAAVLL